MRASPLPEPFDAAVSEVDSAAGSDGDSPAGESPSEPAAESTSETAASNGSGNGEARIVGDEPPVKGLGIAKGARRPGKR